MTIYYGFMVSEMGGSVEDLDNVECNYKPKHETCGFAYAKWFTDEKKRDITREYTIKTIQQMRNK